jgi:putative holliday junction resolvase
VIIGLDYGRKRTGVAVCVQGVVLPSEPIRGGWNEILQKIAILSERYGGVEVVMGLPLSAMGKPTELSAEVEELAQRIKESGYTVDTVNEVRSSAEAAFLLSKSDRKGRIDSVAACEILKRHLGIL